MGWVSNPGAGNTITALGDITANSGAAGQVKLWSSSGVPVIQFGTIATNRIQLFSGDSYLDADGGTANFIFRNNVAATELGRFSSTGLLPTIGLSSPTAVSVNNYVAGQAPATATTGNDTTPVSGTIFFGQVFVPANTTLTGISYLIGTVGGTNNVIVGLYNNAGTLVKNSALAGALVGSPATMQRVPFTSTYAAIGPAMYWVSVSMNGTTARLRTHAFGDHAAASAAGVFGTLGNISPVTTFTANTAPYAMTY